jgi:AcrR family transcriptional regulator
MHNATPISRRERLRTQTVVEIKQQALAQIVDGGSEQVSLNAIARSLGMSAPALYRYFRSRDDLLVELAADGWTELAEAFEAAADGSSATTRLRRVVGALRSWAHARPNVYLLVFASRFGSGVIDRDRVVVAAHRCMAVLVDILSGDGQARPNRPVAPELAEQLAAWAQAGWDDSEVSPAVLQRAVLAWTRFHGLISLEIQGTFTAMGIDAGLLIEAEVRNTIDHGVA